YGAAYQYKLYQANPNNYNYVAGRNNYIQYNPNTACGGSIVYIENQATAGLYNYTPYQPNKATRDAPIGQEVHCGAYGNKNFLYNFVTWFGSPHKEPDYSLVQCSDGKYLIEKVSNRRRLINDTDASHWGFSPDDFDTLEYKCNLAKFD